MSPLFKPIMIGGVAFSNRIAVLDHLVLNPLNWSGEQLELIAHEALPHVAKPSPRRPLADPEKNAT